MGYELTGRVWTAESFPLYVAILDLSWAKGITMHHTGVPSLAQRPRGLTARHLENLRHFYEKEKGWSAGPHLFVDDDQIWGLSSLERPGVHAKSFNRTRIGIEVLGDYDEESPGTGRGARCWEMAAAACRGILAAKGWDASRINGHRDDPRTKKSCPGAKVDLDGFRDFVQQGGTADRPGGDADFREGLLERLDNISWQVRKMREEIANEQ